MILFAIQRLLRGWSRFLALFLVSLITIGWLNGQAIAAAPNAVNSCIPSAQVARTELVAQTQMQGKTYYLFNAYEQSEEESASPLLISVSGSNCQTAFYSPGGDSRPLSSVVSQPVAQQLTLQRYRPAIARLGKEAVQTQVNGAAAGTLWYAEEVWALQQLGIKIPAQVKVQSP
jgi:hypothetical protein